MPVQNVECQIATAQIGRYLAGDALSAETVRQLEDHIAECDECQETVAERRAALQAMLEEPEQRPDLVATAVVQHTPPKSIAAALQQKVRQQLEAKALAPAIPQPAPSKPMAWKPIAYSGVLAAVLIGMSYFAKNPSLGFGAKAADVLPLATSIPTVKARSALSANPTKAVDSAENHPPAIKPIEHNLHPAMESKTYEKPIAKPVAKKAPARSKPKFIAARPHHPARALRRLALHRGRWHRFARPSAQPHGAGIRVYDSAGSLIQH